MFFESNKDSTFKLLAYFLLIVAVCISIYSFYVAKGFLYKPFPGFISYNNLVVSEVTRGGWTGVGSGIESYDIIKTVQDHPVQSAQELYSLIRELPLGTDVSYKVLRNNELVTLTVPTMEFNLNDFLIIYFQVAFVGIVLIILGFFVYFNNPKLIAGKVFLLMCFFGGFWFVSIFETHSTHTLYNIPFLGLIFWPTLGTHLSFVFPNRKKIIKDKPYLILVPYAVSLILAILMFTKFSNPVLWTRVEKSIWVYIFIGGFIITINTLFSYLYSIKPIDKQRSKIVLIGSFFGFCVPALVAMLMVFFKISNLNSLVGFVLIFPISIAYAIVKHKLFDIQELVQKALVYGLSSGVVASLFILPLFLLNLKVSTENLWKNPVYLLLLSIGVILIINPLQNLIQRFVDTLFFRKKYDYATTITEFSDKLSSLLSISEISNELMYIVNKTLFVEKGYLFVIDKDTGSFELTSSIPRENFNNEQVKFKIFDGSNPLVEFLYKNMKEIFVEDVISENQYAQKRIDLLKTYADFKSSLIVPLFFKSDLLGILLLSNKKSGQMFTTEDINFIRTISNQVAISLENSFSFELIQGYANEVEEKNKQLKNVQAQLIQSEKMSAIGHLASGIAHEIRNPLNIIEGARYYLSSLITNGSENVVAQEYLEYIQNEVVRTNRLIDSLLDFSKFQETNIENINVNNVVENVLILSRKQLSDSNIKIKKNLEENLPTLKGDSNQLWQVVINLLMNSVQAINSIPDMKGDGEIVVETGIYTKPGINYLDHLYLKVMDNGCGIKEKDLSSIFDPFYTNKPDGTGLGLSVSYKIVEAHSGSMLVTSEVGIGTSFMVELPVVNRFSGEVINEQKENLNS